MNTLPLPNHPCFDANASHAHARIHLPVAPRCNVQCNYCNRKFDCVNESRPGVASAVLTPAQALAYVREADAKIKNLSVVGIAGPGDPFANPKETLLTLRLIKQAFPDKLFCVSTNGLNLVPYIDELCDIGVSHVTLTINAVDPVVSSKIYAWVKADSRILKGLEGANFLLDQQLSSLSLLQQRGIKVKVNSVVIPAVNDFHIQEVAKRAGQLGAATMNVIPLLPTLHTPFANFTEPDKQLIATIRDSCREFLPIMSHCKRCRADAIGILGNDNKEMMERMEYFSQKSTGNYPSPPRPYVAVATSNALLVDQHLGEAVSFHVFEKNGKGFNLVDVRQAPPTGQSDLRWIRLAKSLIDCKALIVVKAGPNPQFILENRVWQ
ncbi:MAG: nitrogenase cofactor biosynthesis protein NifB [Breznakibacter sp.]